MFLEQMQEGFAFVFKPKTLKLILKIIGFLLLLLLLFKMAGCIASHMNKKGERKLKSITTLKRRKPCRVTHTEIKHESVQAQSENNKVEVAVRAI